MEGPFVTMVSHEGKLYAITERGDLYEITIRSPAGDIGYPVIRYLGELNPGGRG